MPPIVMSTVSGGGLAACASEVPWAGSEAVLAEASGFVPPITSGTLNKNESVMTRNTNYQKKRLNARVYPSRVPKDSGFFRLARFANGADALPDGRFTPPADASMSFAETTGSSTGCGGAVGATASPTLASAALLAAASASAFASNSLVATSCSTDTLAFIASMHTSTYAIHA